MTDNYENEEPFIEKPKHGWIKILLLLLIIGGLAYGGYYYYVNYYNNPVQKVNTVITSLEEKINEKLKSTLSIGDKAYKINGLIKTNINFDEKNERLNYLNKNFNDFAIQINGEIDVRSKSSNLDISSKANNEKLINGKIYTDGNNIYVRSEEIYEKYILLDDIEATNSSEKTELSDVSKLYNLIISSFIKNLNTNNATKTDQIVKYNNNNVEVNDYKLAFTSKDLNQIAKDVYTDLKNNIEFINILKKVDDNALDRIEKELFVDNNISNEQNSPVIYEINFYTTKDITNEKLIKIKQSFFASNINLVFDIDFIDEDTYLITISMNDYTASIRLTINNNILSIDYNMDLTEGKININANFNYEEISMVSKEDVSNCIKVSDIEKLTEEEKSVIDSDMKSNENLVDFLQNISNFILYDYTEGENF